MTEIKISSREINVVSRSTFMGMEIDVYGTAYEPFFKATDVAAWLGLSNVSDMTMRVEEDERSKFNLGRQGETWFLTENGLYEVLMQSRKPIAKQFKKGVKEILKKIRKTGSYTSTAIPQPTTMQDKLLAATWVIDTLNLNGASKLAIAKSIADPLGLPTPDYVMNEKTVHAAKDLLATHGIKMTSAAFNKLLEANGIVERMTRQGKGGKVHSWVVIPKKYEVFGQNARNEHAQNQTQALWYDDKFSELLAMVGIQEGKEANND